MALQPAETDSTDFGRNEALPPDPVGKMLYEAAMAGPLRVGHLPTPPRRRLHLNLHVQETGWTDLHFCSDFLLRAPDPAESCP
jgi:hypothetical protein